MALKNTRSDCFNLVVFDSNMSRVKRHIHYSFGWKRHEFSVFGTITLI